MASALGLLRASGVRSASELSQARVGKYLHRHRGRRTNVMRFLSWVAGRSWQAFDVGAGRRTAPRKRERATLQKAANLLARLEATRDEREGRSLLASAISVVHGIPLESVLSLRMEEVSIQAKLVVPWSDDRAVRLATTLSAPFARLAPSGGKYAFPGRNPNRPASTAGIMHHAGQARSGRARIVGAAR